MEKISEDGVTRGVPHNVPTGVPTDFLASDDDNIDDKELTEDALIHSYIIMFWKWLEFVKVNQKLTRKIAQLNVGKKRST